LLLGAGNDMVLSGAKGARRWLVGGLVVGLLAGMSFFLVKTPTYSATVAVELSDVTPILDLSPAGPRVKPVTIDTDAQLMAADEVVSVVAQRVGRTRSQARKSMSVSARPLTRVLQLTYTDRSAAVARAGAQTGAETFLRMRDRVVIEPVRDYLLGIRAATRGVAPEPVNLADMGLSEEPTLEIRRKRALQQQLQLPGPGQVISDARLTADGDRGDPEVPLASGASLGALLGFLIGIARQRPLQWTREPRTGSQLLPKPMGAR
jgi:hypothetical protein